MINGYKMLKKTPIVVDRSAESPAMSWGRIKGEPVFLGNTSKPQNNAFKVQATPIRDEIGFKMASATQQKKRDEKANEK